MRINCNFYKPNINDYFYKYLVFTYTPFTILKIQFLII